MVLFALETLKCILSLFCSPRDWIFWEGVAAQAPTPAPAPSTDEALSTCPTILVFLRAGEALPSEHDVPFMTSHTPLCGYGINIRYLVLQVLALDSSSQTLGI